MELKDIYLNIIEPVQYEVGRLWQINQISVARGHLCTTISDMIISQFRKEQIKSKKSQNTIISTCIDTEQHELGIKMISNLLINEGWNVFYIGANVPIESILSIIEEQNADLLAISAALITHIYKIKELIDEIRSSEWSDIEIIVGGGAFNKYPELMNSYPKVWEKIGANGYAPNAREAIRLVENLLLG